MSGGSRALYQSHTTLLVVPFRGRLCVSYKEAKGPWTRRHSV